MNLINRAACKKRALEIAQMRAWKPTRVSAEFLNRIESQLRNIIVSEVQSHPSKGKTLK